MRTILVTGFGRFPGSPVNPSGLVATRLVGRRRPALEATRRIAHVFATRYDAVDRELPAVLAREKPDVVMMFGVATRACGVRIEERARNRIALLPDADGYRPPGYRITSHPDALRTRLASARLVKAARATGVAAEPSRNAGAYLCNYIYWRALEAADRPDGPGFVIFIHLPPVGLTRRPKKRPEKWRLRKQRPEKRQTRNYRPPRLYDLVRAGEAIMLAVISLTAGRR